MSEAAAAVAAPAAPAAAPAIAWMPDADTDTVGFVQNKGWAGPADAIKGYRQLETFVGAERAGRGVVIPKDDADPVEVGAFYERLGRPSTAEGYRLPVPEGQDGEFAKLAATKFHELGITAKQGQALAEWFNEHGQGLSQQQQEAEAAAFQQEQAALDRDWGAQKGERTELARRAVAQMAEKAGLPQDKVAAGVDALAKAFGFSGAMKMFALVGDSMREAGAKGLDAPGSFALTPEAARARLQEIKAQAASDPAYAKRLGMDGSAEWGEVTKLNRILAGL